jgi:lauroyl/myristoyl acyltransferase
MLTEDYYVYNKLARGLIGTPHVDTNSRLCMSSAVTGYKLALGADAPPCSYEDFDHADCVLIAGSNMAYAHPVQIYKPLHNKYMDEVFKRIRARFGGYNVPKHSTAREIIRLRRDNKRVAVGMITDQSPNPNEAHYWTTFLNQDTVFMDGAERIAKLMDFPVFYCELQKQGRGYCRVRFDLITETPKATADGEITERFARRLEQTIRREPAYWFWSHKRWKLKREDTIQHG